MEQRMQRVSEAVKNMSAALRQYAEVQADISILSDYYGSDDWKKDYDDDAAGLLPKNLKRGVLSEDALWNLLEDIREIEVTRSNRKNLKK